MFGISQSSAIPAPRRTERGLSVVMHSCDLDKVLAGLTIANGAALCDDSVNVFFSFWSVSVLRRRGSRSPGGSLLTALLCALIPRGGEDLGLSRLNWAGVGARLMRRRMCAEGIPSVEQQLRTARRLGVIMYVCATSLAMLGLSMTDLRDDLGLVQCGVATFLDRSADARQTLFIG